jgi:hypothetical protein
MLPAMATATARRKRRRYAVVAGEELYNSSTLEWGSLVRNDTARILKSGLLVGCRLLRVFQAHSARARWSFQGLYFRPGRFCALLLARAVACARLNEEDAPISRYMRNVLGLIRNSMIFVAGSCIDRSPCSLKRRSRSLKPDWMKSVAFRDFG